MDMRTIISVLKGYYGDSFTEAQVKKHLKKSNLSGISIDEVVAEAKKEGLIHENK